MQIFDIPINSKRMETTRIGTFDFPLAVHKNDLKKNVLGFVNWHWHYEFQFTYALPVEPFPCSSTSRPSTCTKGRAFTSIRRCST